MLGLVTRPQLNTGSKRNLTTNMTEVTNNNKKPRVEAVKEERRIPPGRKLRCSKPPATLVQLQQPLPQTNTIQQHLLLAAGLKVGRFYSKAWFTII